ncbi:MAG: caspase domain-containing protein [Deferribacterales bacterium]
MKKLIFLLLLPVFAFGADRAVTPAVSDPAQFYSSSAALVIGEYSYGSGWPALPGVKQDIEAVEQTLKESGFQVIKSVNPDRQALMTAVRNFFDRYGSEPKARVLIYFAGHGHTLEKNGRRAGYLVLKDAADPNKDMKGFLNGSIEIDYFPEMAKNMKAQHSLFVFDSCFSGTVFTAMRSIPEFLIDMLRKPAREFISSGSENQQVPDESVFRRRFTEGVTGRADSNGDGVVTGSELGMFLQKEVTVYSGGTQTPVFGKLRGSDGEFIFFAAEQQKNDEKTAERPVPSGEKEKLLSIIRKSPGSPEANDALKRLREIDDSLKNRPPVEAKERKDLVMTATSKKITNTSYSDTSFPYVVIAPVTAKVNGTTITAAFKIEADTNEHYRMLTQRKDMLRSVIQHRMEKLETKDMSMTQLRDAVKHSAKDAVDFACPSCSETDPVLVGLKVR